MGMSLVAEDVLSENKPDMKAMVLPLEKPETIHQGAFDKSASAQTVADKSDNVQKPVAKSYQPSKRISEMNYEEIKEWLSYARTGNDDQLTLKLIDRALQKKPDYAIVQSLLLERGDLLYKLERFSEAKETYDKYYALYPRCTDSERALMRAIECSKKLILDIEHDQTQTKETIRLADAFLECELFTQHRKEVEEIRVFCYNHLFDYECRICRFYTFQENFLSADARFDSIVTSFDTKLITDFDKRIQDLSQEITTAKTESGIVVVAQGKKAESAKELIDAEKTITDITAKQTPAVVVAQAPAKKTFVDRF